MIQVKWTPQIFALLSYTPLQYMLRAMAAGSAPHTCWADREADPSVCIVLEGHSLFVGGDAQSPAADKALDFLAHKILTPELRQELHVIKIVYPDDAWKEKLQSAFAGNEVYVYMRSVFRHPTPDTAAVQELPQIRLISEDMKKLDNFSMIQNEVESTLGSVVKFLAMGFGSALVMENRVCGFCTAEYISAGECAIGIEVLQEYQQKGYATQMTALFLRESARRGLVSYWECWKNNIPSAKTAERSSFEKLADYPVVFVVFSDPGKA